MTKLSHILKYYQVHGIKASLRRIKYRLTVLVNSSAKDIGESKKNLYRSPTLVDHVLGRLTRDRLDEIEIANLKTYTLISMVKNEIDIIEKWLVNNLKLFDRLIVIDHQSTDGTYELLLDYQKAYKQLEVYQFKNSGYHQSELMTWAYDRLINKNENGWVVFLDADEFIKFDCKSEFNKALAQFNEIGFLSLPWLNVIPCDFDKSELDCDYYVGNKTSMYNKIALQPRLLADKKFRIAQGNHSIECDIATASTIKAAVGFEIYHFPVRTKVQLMSKLENGLASYNDMGDKRKESDGFHWFEMNKIINESGFSFDLFSGFIVHYAEPLDSIKKYQPSDLEKNGYDKINFKFFANEKVRPKSRSSLRYSATDPKKLMHVHNIHTNENSIYMN